MIIGGLQKFSLLDYPGNISAIVFTQGCNFRCQFCYNPLLVLPNMASKLKNTFSHSQEKEQESHSPVSEDDFFVFLESRANKLDAVVITGGEPTLHPDLLEFAQKIKKLGFKVKLDTNGTNPNIIKKLLKKNLIDYIAMDIKAAPEKYEEATGVKFDLRKIAESIIIIKTSKLPYEFRTTVAPGLVAREDIKKIGAMIKGADQWFLQQFKPDTNLVNPAMEKIKPYTSRDLDAMQKIAAAYVKKCEVR